MEITSLKQTIAGIKDALETAEKEGRLERNYFLQSLKKDVYNGSLELDALEDVCQTNYGHYKDAHDLTVAYDTYKANGGKMTFAYWIYALYNPSAIESVTLTNNLAMTMVFRTKEGLNIRLVGWRDPEYLERLDEVKKGKENYMVDAGLKDKLLSVTVTPEQYHMLNDFREFKSVVKSGGISIKFTYKKIEGEPSEGVFGNQ